MKRSLICAALLAAIGAGATLSVSGSASATAATPASRGFKQETPTYSFEYAYPAAVAAIPALRARLDADRAKHLAALARDARAAAAEAKKDGYPFRKYDWTQTWQVVTSLPGWLSLSAAYWNYTGGAHGMTWSGAMLWDRPAKTARNPFDLFTSKAALSRAIRKPFCAALNQQRAEKRGETVKPGSTDEFDKCIDPVAETVILGSRSRRKFDRIGILVAPYSAGPYAEGPYEVTVPITPAVLAAVKPQFRSSFAQ